MPMSLTVTYLHAGDAGIRGLVRHTGWARHARHGTGCRTLQIIYSYIPPSPWQRRGCSHRVTLRCGDHRSLGRDPTMSCQQIIASNHFPGSLFSDKTRDCIQPPPPALMPTIKTESSLHSSLSQLHFYGRNFQRSSSLNLPRFFQLSPSSIC